MTILWPEAGKDRYLLLQDQIGFYKRIKLFVVLFFTKTISRKPINWSTRTYLQKFYFKVQDYLAFRRFLLQLAILV